MPTFLLRCLVLATVLSTVACGGDSTSANGDLGRVNYRMFTPYLSDDDDLRDVGIVTGHAQTIFTELTLDGRDELDRPGGTLTHRSSAGVLLPVDDGSDPPDIAVTVDTPGPVVIETLDRGEVFDRITLQFAAPDDVELITWAKQPGEAEFQRSNDVDGAVVVRGTQMVFVAVPIAGGRRLLGDIGLGATVEPLTAATVVTNIEAVWEQVVWTDPTPPSLVMVETGTITVTLTDAANGLVVTKTFEVVEPTPAP